ncbi:MAG: transcriptional regulator [Firmicutes bacterium]|nr:transcriptional regulator [Bacillota bacterium]
MTREEFIKQIDGQVKLVRTEYGFTQDVMARVVGISKKTLVEIEKGRSSLGWTGAVALCSVFSGSQVLSGLLGGEAQDMIQALAFEDVKPVFPKTMGGKIWWETVETGKGWKIQQNIISRHYRALDDETGRICSSFSLEEIYQRLKELKEG